MRLARVCCGLIRFSARFADVPRSCDRAVADAAVGVVRVYQRYLSRHTGRTCLFDPTCSHRAIAILHAVGWREGIGAIDAQLARCGGNYTLCMTCSGATFLTTQDGLRFGQDDIAPAILAMRGPRPGLVR